jgi:hypothetical protein
MRVLTLATWLILIWFATSILAEVIGMLIFAWRLRRRGVHLIFGLVGVPGYLEYCYAQWCTSRGESPRRVIALRVLLLLNMILAILFAFPVLSTGSS